MQIFRQTSNETSEVIWVPKDKVLDYITVPFLVKRYEAYLLDYITKPEYNMKLERTV